MARTPGVPGPGCSLGAWGRRPAVKDQVLRGRSAGGGGGIKTGKLKKKKCVFAVDCQNKDPRRGCCWAGADARAAHLAVCPAQMFLVAWAASTAQVLPSVPHSQRQSKGPVPQLLSQGLLLSRRAQFES